MFKWFWTIFSLGAPGSWFVYAPFITGRKQTDYPTDKPRGHANDFLNANWKPYKAETSASRVDKPATPRWSG